MDELAWPTTAADVTPEWLTAALPSAVPGPRSTRSRCSSGTRSPTRTHGCASLPALDRRARDRCSASCRRTTTGGRRSSPPAWATGKRVLRRAGAVDRRRGFPTPTSPAPPTTVGSCSSSRISSPRLRGLRRHLGHPGRLGRRRDRRPRRAAHPLRRSGTPRRRGVLGAREPTDERLRRRHVPRGHRSTPPPAHRRVRRHRRALHRPPRRAAAALARRAAHRDPRRHPHRQPLPRPRTGRLPRLGDHQRQHADARHQLPVDDGDVDRRPPRTRARPVALLPRPAARAGATEITFDEAWRAHRIHASYNVTASCQVVRFPENISDNGRVFADHFLAPRRPRSTISKPALRSAKPPVSDAAAWSSSPRSDAREHPHQLVALRVERRSAGVLDRHRIEEVLVEGEASHDVVKEPAGLGGLGVGGTVARAPRGPIAGSRSPTWSCDVFSAGRVESAVVGSWLRFRTTCM